VGDNRTDDGGDFADTLTRDSKTGRVVGHPPKDIGLRVSRPGR